MYPEVKCKIVGDDGSIPGPAYFSWDDASKALPRLQKENPEVTLFAVEPKCEWSYNVGRRKWEWCSR